MNCFPFLRSTPSGTVSPSRRRGHLRELSVAQLCDIIDALPIAVEVTTSAGGQVYSNREDSTLGSSATFVQISGGVSIRYVVDSRSEDTSPLSDGSSAVAAPPPPPIRLPPSAGNLSSSLEALPVQAWVVTVAGGSMTAIYVNSRYAAFRGIPSGHVPLQSWNDSIHPDDAASMRDAVSLAIRSGSAFKHVYRVRRASDGAYLWFRGDACALRDETGTVTAYACVATDIDEMMQTKARLLVEQQLLAATIEQLPVGAFILAAPHGGVAVSNRKMRELWGPDLPDAVVQQFRAGDFAFASKIYKHLDGRPVEQHELPGYRAFSRGETVSRHELQMHFAGSDKTKFVCISATPVRGPDGAIIAAAAVVEDLTTVRAQDEERHRLRAQAEFLATMNHELRIHGILGLSELLLQTYEDAFAGTKPDSQEDTLASQRQYCHEIRECAALLQSLVSSVLDFSKIDARLMTLEAIPLDLRSFVSKSLTLLRPSALDCAVTLSEQTSDDVPAVLIGDPLRIQQIIINLVNNALKFCQGASGGGRVNVRMSRSPTPPGAAPLSVTILIEVEDNGPGVSADVASRLFRPFVQADVSTTRRFGGTGLGLSIVRGLAELMGGSATVVSPNELGGATFCCLVVLREQTPSCPEAVVVDGLIAAESSSPASRGQLHRSPSHSLRGKRILVVDDISTNRLIAGRFLRALNATVDFAEDGKASIEAVTSAQPPYNLVLMDCHMPVMDGFDAAGAIRQLPDAARARVPIVAISASAQPSDVARSRAAGMDDHIAKPIDSKALASCVLRWVSRG